MNFETLIRKMTQAAAAGDGHAVADCFTKDGTYHDVFYGAFQGRAALVDMIENYFHRDATNFVWDIYDPVSDGHTAYAHYIFSFDSKLPEAAGKRALFEGVCRVTLDSDSGLIKTYREVANPGTGLVMLGFAAERISKIFHREALELARIAGKQHNSSA